MTRLDHFFEIENAWEYDDFVRAVHAALVAGVVVIDSSFKVYDALTGEALYAIEGDALAYWQSKY